MQAELVLGKGERVNRKRVARLMRQAGLQGTCRRKGRKNLVNEATGEDLVRRQFTVTGLDRLWLTGITGHPTTEGKLYCAAVMDACSRRIIGWSIDSRQETGLVVDALGMAILRRRPAGESTILHSDHGTQGSIGRRNIFKRRWANGAAEGMGSCSGGAAGDAFAGAASGGQARTPAGVLGGDRQGNAE